MKKSDQINFTDSNCFRISSAHHILVSILVIYANKVTFYPAFVCRSYHLCLSVCYTGPRGGVAA